MNFWQLLDASLIIAGCIIFCVISYDGGFKAGRMAGYTEGFLDGKNKRKQKFGAE